MEEPVSQVAEGDRESRGVVYYVCVVIESVHYRIGHGEGEHENGGGRENRGWSEF